MSGITDWSEAIANPYFWVNRYCEVDPDVATESLWRLVQRVPELLPETPLGMRRRFRAGE